MSGSALQSALRAAEAPHQVGQRAGDEEIFLHEAQPLAHAGRVVGIEDAGHRLGREPLGQRADELAGAEHLEVEAVGRRRGPQPQRVDRLAAIADDRAIERHAEQAGRPAEDRPQSSPPRTSNEQPSLISTASCGRGDFPGIRMAQPVVGLLALPAVLDRSA